MEALIVTTQVLPMANSRETRLRRVALESQGKSLEEIGALLVQGGEIGAEGTAGIGALPGSEAAGDFLFHLGHANGLFGEIVGEGDVVIGGEVPDIIGVLAQAEQEVRGFTLPCSPAFPRFRNEQIQGFPLWRAGLRNVHTSW